MRSNGFALFLLCVLGLSVALGGQPRRAAEARWKTAGMSVIPATRSLPDGTKQGYSNVEARKIVFV
jgi:hypothetical protein